MGLRVLLVDDNFEFIESATNFLSRIPQINVVGRALCSPDTLELVRLARPDLVIMDLAMSIMNGLQVTARIRTHRNAPRIILLTLHDLAEYRAAAEAADADVFVSKVELGRQLLPLIDSLFAGTWSSDKITQVDPENQGPGTTV